MPINQLDSGSGADPFDEAEFELLDCKMMTEQFMAGSAQEVENNFAGLEQLENYRTTYERYIPLCRMRYVIHIPPCRGYFVSTAQALSSKYLDEGLYL